LNSLPRGSEPNEGSNLFNDHAKRVIVQIADKLT